MIFEQTSKDTFVFYVEEKKFDKMSSINYIMVLGGVVSDYVTAVLKPWNNNAWWWVAWRHFWTSLNPKPHLVEGHLTAWTGRTTCSSLGCSMSPYFAQLESFSTNFQMEPWKSPCQPPYNNSSVPPLIVNSCPWLRAKLLAVSVGSCVATSFTVPSVGLLESMQRNAITD